MGACGWINVPGAVEHLDVATASLRAVRTIIGPIARHRAGDRPAELEFRPLGIAKEMHEVQWVTAKLVVQLRSVEWTAEPKFSSSGLVALRPRVRVRSGRCDWGSRAA